MARLTGQDEELEAKAPLEIDLSLPDIEDLAWLLQPRSSDVDDNRSAERLTQRLPSVLDALIASDDVVEVADGALLLAPAQHAALFALAAEAMVKYHLSSPDLIEHLVHVLLPEWGDRSLDVPLPRTRDA